MMFLPKLKIKHLSVNTHFILVKSVIVITQFKMVNNSVWWVGLYLKVFDIWQIKN